MTHRLHEALRLHPHKSSKHCSNRSMTAVNVALQSLALADSAVNHASTTPVSGLHQALIDLVPQTARFVLLGASTHGTREFDEQRVALTRALIEQCGFNSVVLEADFPDAFRTNCCVKGLSSDTTAAEALADFKRFPRWLWRNRTVEDFVEWLRQHNARSKAQVPVAQGGPISVGFLGLDLYSLHTSAQAVVQHLRQSDPAAAAQIEERYHCLDKYGSTAEAYGTATGLFDQPDCQHCVQASLSDLTKRCKAQRTWLKGDAEQEGLLQVQANALAVASAESFYRHLFCSDAATCWNLRTQHFLEMLQLLERHLESCGVVPRIVIWAHNNHVADARASDLGWRRHEHSLGQLLRQTYTHNAVHSIGMTTYTGTVSAAREWDVALEEMQLPPAAPNSLEAFLHSAQLPIAAWNLHDAATRHVLSGTRQQRVLGVVYTSSSDQRHDYHDGNVCDEFDSLLHVDTTNALQPLGGAARVGHSEDGRPKDMDETFPTGL